DKGARAPVSPPAPSALPDTPRPVPSSPQGPAHKSPTATPPGVLAPPTPKSPPPRLPLPAAHRPGAEGGWNSPPTTLARPARGGLCVPEELPASHPGHRPRPLGNAHVQREATSRPPPCARLPASGPRAPPGHQGLPQPPQPPLPLPTACTRHGKDPVLPTAAPNPPAPSAPAYSLYPLWKRPRSPYGCPKHTSTLCPGLQPVPAMEKTPFSLRLPQTHQHPLPRPTACTRHGKDPVLPTAAPNTPAPSAPAYSLYPPWKRPRSPYGCPKHTSTLCPGLQPVPAMEKTPFSLRLPQTHQHPLPRPTACTRHGKDPVLPTAAPNTPAPSAPAYSLYPPWKRPRSPYGCPKHTSTLCPGLQPVPAMEKTPFSLRLPQTHQHPLPRPTACTRHGKDPVLPTAAPNTPAPSAPAYSLYPPWKRPRSPYGCPKHTSTLCPGLQPVPAMEKTPFSLRLPQTHQHPLPRPTACTRHGKDPVLPTAAPNTPAPSAPAYSLYPPWKRPRSPYGCPKHTSTLCPGLQPVPAMEKTPFSLRLPQTHQHPLPRPTACTRHGKDPVLPTAAPNTPAPSAPAYSLYPPWKRPRSPYGCPKHTSTLCPGLQPVPAMEKTPFSLRLPQTHQHPLPRPTACTRHGKDPVLPTAAPNTPAPSAPAYSLYPPWKRPRSPYGCPKHTSTLCPGLQPVPAMEKTPFSLRLPQTHQHPLPRPTACTRHGKDPVLPTAAPNTPAPSAPAYSLYPPWKRPRSPYGCPKHTSTLCPGLQPVPAMEKTPFSLRLPQTHQHPLPRPTACTRHGKDPVLPTAAPNTPAPSAPA
uniref:Uncharacterized protein n=1 Tax=Pelodiscus sinensis TaxID=13735 RepID=K7G781_PELSI